MPFLARVISLAVLFVAVSALAFDAWAGGPGGGIATCQVTNSSGGALAIRGTVAVETLQSVAVATDVDYTFRLTRSGATAFFRFTKNALVFGKTNEDVLCLALDDLGLSAQILAAFNLPPNRRLVITDKSITNAEVQSLDQIIPGTGRASTMGDIVIYAQ
jgi:hypothetical protein